MDSIPIDWRLFENFLRLIAVTIGDTVYHLPEHNSLLRGIQFLDPGCLQHGNFCWNADCRTCEVEVLSGCGGRALACQLRVGPGLRLAGPPRGVRLPVLSEVQCYTDLPDEGGGGDQSRS